MLDFVNCASGRGAPVHTTTWDAASNAALTRAPLAFGAGEEIVEEYGQPNYIYQLYHGFALENNEHDCLLLPDERTCLAPGKWQKDYPAETVLEAARGIRQPADPDPSISIFLAAEAALAKRLLEE